MLALQAVVSLNKSPFESGLGSIKAAVSNATGAMMMAFGGVGGEIFAMTKAFGPMGAAVGIMKESVNVGASFEQQMANVASVSGLVGDELIGVSDAARDMAKTTRFTATQAGDALYSLASAGMSTSDAMISTLRPSLLLAGATLSDTTLATETMTAALANFNIPASDATRVADQFAGAIASSPANMERLGDAFKYAGPAAAGFGISLEKTVAEVAAFHVAGMRGEMAGTAFRQVLIQLSKASEDTSSVIGSALQGWTAGTEGITGAVKRLNAAGVDTDQVIRDLGARAGPALAAMMNIGAEAMQQLAQRISENADVAKMYETQIKTLTGKFYIFKSAVSDIFQELFVNLSPALQKLTENATKVTDAFGDMVKAMFAGDWDAVKKMITGVFDSAIDSARNVVNYISSISWFDVFASLRNAALQAFSGWYGFAADAYQQIADYLRGADGAALWSGIQASAVAVWTEIQDVAKNIWPVIQNYALSAWEAISQAGRVAMETLANSISGVDFRDAFDSISIYLFNALKNALRIALNWWSDLNDLIGSIKWGELASMAYEAMVDARDFIVSAFRGLVSSGVIGDVFRKIGETIGTLIKAAFEMLGDWWRAAWNDLVSGNWKSQAESFFKTVFVGGLQAITGLFTGVLEGIFGRNIIDRVVAGAMLMMLDIKKAIQTKIGEILTVFNELMAGIITKTSEGAARVAEVFGFEGMAEKIQAKSEEFAEAFRSGTNGMTEAAEETGKEIKNLEQYIINLDKPVEKVADSFEKTTKAVDKTEKVTEKMGDTTEKTADAFMAYDNPLKTFQEKLRENIVEMGKATVESGKLEKGTEGVAEAVEKTAKSTEKSTEEIGKLYSAFGEMNDFDVANFTSRMKLLAAGLRGLDMPDISLPDFSNFKIPNITNQSLTRFASALLRLSKITGVDLSALTTISEILKEIKIPEIDGVSKFLAAMTTLRDGLVKLDFGKLGKMDVNIKGSIVSQKLDDIYKLIRGAEGVIWA